MTLSRPPLRDVDGARTRGAPLDEPLFRSFFLGGFECSSHRRADGRRLDLLALTAHDRYAAADYAALVRHGIRTVRDGVRWHLVEEVPGRYDWASVVPMVRAASEAGVEVIWDLCHYGWPDHVDVWSPQFVDAFARFAAETARIVAGESDDVPFYCPVNEISYLAWAGGEVGLLNPCAAGQGQALKRQLIRATIAAIEAIRAVDPRARFVTAEPLIHIDAGHGDPDHVIRVEGYRRAQFEATEMLCGAVAPELGGAPGYLDIVGVNYYPENQWYAGGKTIPMGHHAYRPLAELLEEMHARYRRPLFIAETGAEGSGRASWLHYVAAEVRAAIAAGVPVGGICLYPIVDYPGWDNDRTCAVGLLTSSAPDGSRTVHGPLAEELAVQQAMVAGVAPGALSPQLVTNQRRAGYRAF